MIMRVITLMGCAIAGYLAGGIWGAVGLLLLWAGVLLACRQFGGRGTQNAEQPEVAAKTSVFANIDAVNDTLEDIARDRGWDLDKRLEVARLACEYPSVSVDELEDLYERGLRAVPDESGQDAAKARKNGDGRWNILP